MNIITENITENVTGGETATMTCVRWPNPAKLVAGPCAAPAVILTHQPSMDAKSAVVHAIYQMAGSGNVVRGMDVSGSAKDGDVIVIDPDATDKKFDTRLGLKTWSPPPV